MIEKINKVGNPLTVIAIFAGLAEIAGTIALAAVDKSLQPTFVWFVMLFPIFLVTLFFITLNFNPKVLYAPSDFKNENLFLDTLRGKSLGKEGVKVEVNDNGSNDGVAQNLKVISKKSFIGENVELDNHHYKSCQFSNCNMVFKGKGRVALEQCEFSDVRWHFTDYAGHSIGFLAAMYTGFGDGGKQLVESTFENIRKGLYNKEGN